MRIFSFVLLLGLFVVPAEGQTILSRPYEPNQFAVEAIAPDASDASVLSGATFLTATLSLSDNIELAGELPVARYGPSVSGASSTSALGNPYLGLGFSGTEIPFLIQIGARIPAAPSNPAATIGRTADIGRTSAFRPDELVLSALLNGRFPLGRYSSLRLRTGLGHASAPTPGPTSGHEQNWRMYYEAQIWGEGDQILTGISFTGRASLTRTSNTQHHAVLSVMGNWRRVQPGLVGGLSLNDLVQDSAFAPFAGLTLSVTYR